MASGISSQDFGGKLDVFDTGKKLYIITETPWYFWLTTIFFVLALISIPYLLYLMYDYYEKIPEANKTEEDKKYFNGGIAMTVILSIAIIAVIAGFIATEARKGGGKLDREQLEDYGKSLIVKGVAVNTAKQINGEGTKFIDETSKLIATKVVNGDKPEEVSSWINLNKEQKAAAINAAIDKDRKERPGTYNVGSNQLGVGAGSGDRLGGIDSPDRPAPPEPEPEPEEAAAARREAARNELLKPLPSLDKIDSPISLSRASRRKSPSSLKKKKASPTKKKKASPKKKSTSSRRK